MARCFVRMIANTGDLQIPREYWKIVVFRNDQNKPRALAFVLSQAALIKTLPTEDFMVGPYEVYQVKVREIEMKTKLDFGDVAHFRSAGRLHQRSILRSSH